MATYTYETAPETGDLPRRFEITQGMSEAPLTHDPKTGEPVRRVITGGMGLVGQSAATSPCEEAGCREIGTSTPSCAGGGCGMNF